ncbi:hypothetical protein NQ317_013529, partial [Molorchus minor]
PQTQTLQLKFCPFKSSYNTTIQYICFKYERCCPQGCCYSYSYTYFQSWYFWTIIVVFFLIFYTASWYCKRAEIKFQRRQRARTISGRMSPPGISPNRNEDGNVDHLLDCLIETYRYRNINETRFEHLGPPPKYRDALTMPKLERNDTQFAQIHAISGENDMNTNENPPTYEDATNKQKGNT